MESLGKFNHKDVHVEILAPHNIRIYIRNIPVQTYYFHSINECTAAFHVLCDYVRKHSFEKRGATFTFEKGSYRLRALILISEFITLKYFFPPIDFRREGTINNQKINDVSLIIDY